MVEEGENNGFKTTKRKEVVVLFLIGFTVSGVFDSICGP